MKYDFIRLRTKRVPKLRSELANSNGLEFIRNIFRSYKQELMYDVISYNTRCYYYDDNMRVIFADFNVATNEFVFDIYINNIAFKYTSENNKEKYCYITSDKLIKIINHFSTDVYIELIETDVEMRNVIRSDFYEKYKKHIENCKIDEKEKAAYRQRTRHNILKNATYGHYIIASYDLSKRSKPLKEYVCVVKTMNEAKAIIDRLNLYIEEEDRIEYRIIEMKM